MAELPGFQKTQLAFSAHIRDPEHTPCPSDIEERRMAIYSRLFYNNIEGFLRNGFPVLHKLYSDAHWHRMARDFFARHQSRSPLFLEISQEFLAYLQNEHETQPYDPPFLLELAHYEWVELALSVAEDKTAPPGLDPNGDLLEAVPVLSPLAWMLSYAYPVHRISPHYQPTQAPEQATHIVVYRTREDEVHFMHINPVTAQLLQMIQADTGKNGAQLLQEIAQAMQHPNPQTVQDGGAQTLESLRACGIVLGTR